MRNSSERSRTDQGRGETGRSRRSTGRRFPEDTGRTERRSGRETRENDRSEARRSVRTRGPEKEKAASWEIGTVQTLFVVRRKEQGVYLGKSPEAEEVVLLPARQVPEGVKEGDPVEVFLYLDSQDRPIATTGRPKLLLGETAVLEVKQVTQIGAFLDWGLEKDLFLPFKEQAAKVKTGDKVFAGLYLDKSGRLCATSRVSRFLSAESPYQKDDKVKGIIYELSRDLGAFVAVDGKYFGLIPKQEWYEEGRVGDTVEARVLRVRPDGKLDLSGRKKAYKQLENDAAFLLRMVEDKGEVFLHDKSDPEEIQKVTGLSKNAFKRAVGHLLKQEKIELTGHSIRGKKTEEE